MTDKLADTLFVRVLPVLLSGAIVWMMTSISDLQVQNARIEQQIIESHKLLTLSSRSIKELDGVVDRQRVDISLLIEQNKTLNEDFKRHMQQHHGG